MTRVLMPKPKRLDPLIVIWPSQDDFAEVSLEIDGRVIDRCVVGGNEDCNAMVRRFAAALDRYC